MMRVTGPCITRHRLRAARHGGRVGRGILEVPIGVIFDDEHIVTNAEGVDGFASGYSQCTRSRVLANASEGGKSVGFSAITAEQQELVGRRRERLLMWLTSPCR